MNMHIFKWLFIPLLVTSLSVLGQNTTLKSDTTIIETLDSNYLNKTKKIVTLLNTDTFIIVASYKVFITSLKNQIRKYDNPGDKFLLNEYEQTFSEIHVDGERIAKTPELVKDSRESLILSLVNKGQCIILNKYLNRLETKIMSIKYVEKGYISRNKIENFTNQKILDIIKGFF
jgi:hypothetical protein